VHLRSDFRRAGSEALGEIATGALIKDFENKSVLSFATVLESTMRMNSPWPAARNIVAGLPLLFAKQQ
jgi:hypothetical protein